MGGTTVVAVEEVDGRLRITVSSDHLPLVADEIILATGSDVDVTRDPLFRELLPLGVTTTGGFPNVDEDLRIARDVDVFLMGGYASLRLGPTAGNLMGGRAGANLLSDVLLDDLLPQIEQTTHHHVRCLCGKENIALLQVIVGLMEDNKALLAKLARAQMAALEEHVQIYHECVSGMIALTGAHPLTNQVAVAVDDDLRISRKKAFYSKTPSTLPSAFVQDLFATACNGKGVVASAKNMQVALAAIKRTSANLSVRSPF
ncbi:hypothetical protein SPRG_18243 [Saprolegnia parasitica CBS 223.65]|uniref:FAD/NAD(P)-binding domain-containing protein n=1 Tax=Saprolegnia parasitica (strain CBS 223.65) TaxID=695850 RepID=A0A067BHN2_SAPPC|nr:hypothetical protein SPRG_18243 [Saprolegnia parasitica CBS 223.65]KDO16220.1 hypothetical protein SPRG_18243 [Saprolegnia parasitica CBS 223.65]|eukprot:XP_012213070.1 hypothetical protein SPRG_18243 [Saprolegnia parasitica CBS 223.65]